MLDNDDDFPDESNSCNPQASSDEGHDEEDIDFDAMSAMLDADDGLENAADTCSEQLNKPSMNANDIVDSDPNVVTAIKPAVDDDDTDEEIDYNAISAMLECSDDDDKTDLISCQKDVDNFLQADDSSEDEASEVDQPNDSRKLAFYEKMYLELSQAAYLPMSIRNTYHYLVWSNITNDSKGHICTASMRV